ncbi:hypothetical protein [Xanthomonas citri]|uniref:hypothetical protein n=1 Tax=Xanthomonas citri TaxID=346 RepID=UPI0006871E92|nr:hypothetical protein [Xanthomonas citri]QTK37300.1 hypothetical protein XcgCFBP7119R_12850 [Xanthomonas citri pv. glycines]
MSAQILQFPIRDAYEMYAVRAVRECARSQGLDVQKTERAFLRSGCDHAMRAELAERARRARMQTTDFDGPEAA